MERIELGDNDVVDMPAVWNFTNTSTSKMKDIRDSFFTFLGQRYWWFSACGVDCKVLPEAGDGWRKGKLKLIMVFEPGPIPEAPNVVVSVLDDLREPLSKDVPAH
jgi:KGK domain